MAVAHWVIFNAKREPVKCEVGKRAEKAKGEITKLTSYSMKEIGRERCPFCNPKPKQETGQDQEPEAVTLHSEEKEATDTGYCSECGGHSFGLKYVSRIMVRECNGCGVWLNLTTLKLWGE